MIEMKLKGSFKKTETFFHKASKLDKFRRILERYGQEGVDALAAATPIDSGETANSWRYEIEVYQRRSRLTWYNTHIVDGVSIAMILQYGHGTRDGSYVSGYDYINPAIKPILEKIAQAAWQEVKAL